MLVQVRHQMIRFDVPDGSLDGTASSAVLLDGKIDTFSPSVIQPPPTYDNVEPTDDELIENITKNLDALKDTDFYRNNAEALVIRFFFSCYDL